jgi:hypothetical protein
MNKKTKSTRETFVESLGPKERAEYDAEYRNLLLSELLFATHAQDDAAINKLIQAYLQERSRAT